MEDIRAFIAVKIDDKIKEEVTRLLEILRQSQSPVKWVEAKNLHLTLRFLGNISQEQLPQYYYSLENALKGVQPFEVAFQDLGGFPHLKRPRVLYLGVKRGEEELISLYRDISLYLDQASLLEKKKGKKERFSPHLTLGRVRSQRGLGKTIDIIKENKNFQAGTMMVEDIHLVKSTLTPKGPKYNVMKSFSL